MKANEVLKILKVTRPTLTKYVKDGRFEAANTRGKEIKEVCFRGLKANLLMQISTVL